MRPAPIGNGVPTDVLYTNPEGDSYYLHKYEGDAVSWYEQALDQDFDTYGGPTKITVEHRDGTVEFYVWVPQ